MVIDAVHSLFRCATALGKPPIEDLPMAFQCLAINHATITNCNGPSQSALDLKC